MFTSGIVSTWAGQRSALFFTGRQQAGENLATVLAHRARALGPPIQLCDALSRHLPTDLEVIVANCLIELQRHATELAATPQAWLPWNYRQTLERARAPSHAPD